MLTLALAASFLLRAAITASSGDLEAVRQAENRWSKAFVTGDTAFLKQLLAPGYVSVGSKGAPHDRAVVIDSAAKYAAAHPNQSAKELSPSSTIDITGDLALVRHQSETERSVDVLQKRKGRWIAVYSQHTAVDPAHT